MALLNKQGYDPYDDDSESGYRRPPKNPYCINDYFFVLAGIEDEGEFAAKEMMEMLSRPTEFFA